MEPFILIYIYTPSLYLPLFLLYLTLHVLYNLLCSA